MAVRLAALLRVRPHPEVAVAEGEERLGQAEVVVAELALDEPPRLGREAVLGEPGRDGWWFTVRRSAQNLAAPNPAA